MASRNRKTQNTESSGKNSRTGSGKQNTQTRAVKKQPEVYEEEPDYDGGTLGTEVSIIVTFAVCALLFLSNFGLIGAFVAFFLQWGLYSFLESVISRLDTLQMITVVPFVEVVELVIVVYLLTGILVGVLGGLLSIRKFLKV